MTRRERQQRVAWCIEQMQTTTGKERELIRLELCHYARQDRRRAKRRNTK